MQGLQLGIITLVLGCYHLAAFASTGSEANLGLAWRLIVIVVFLLLMWLGLKSFATRVKQGQIHLPQFLSQGNKFFSKYCSSGSQHKFQLEPIQKQVFPDGSELWVLENQGRYILLSKTLQSGIRYLCDLASPVIESPVDKA